LTWTSEFLSQHAHAQSRVHAPMSRHHPGRDHCHVQPVRDHCAQQVDLHRDQTGHV
jgi:hypothetical protein